MSETGMQRNDQADRAVRAFDFFLQCLSEIDIGRWLRIAAPRDQQKTVPIEAVENGWR